MTREVHGRFPLSAAGLTLALVISGALAHAQQPNIQDLPNMGQQITPLAPQGSRFEPMNPDLPDKPDWLAGQAVTTVVSPDHKTLLVLTSGYNRVFNTRRPATAVPMVRPGLERVRVHLRHFDAHAGQEASSADPEYLQRDCLRSIRHGFLRGRWRQMTTSTSLRGAPPEPGRSSPELRLPWATATWALALTVQPDAGAGRDQQPGWREALRRRRGDFE